MNLSISMITKCNPLFFDERLLATAKTVAVFDLGVNLSFVVLISE